MTPRQRVHDVCTALGLQTCDTMNLTQCTGYCRAMQEAMSLHAREAAERAYVEGAESMRERAAKEVDSVTYQGNDLAADIMAIPVHG